MANMTKSQREYAIRRATKAIEKSFQAKKPEYHFNPSEVIELYDFDPTQLKEWERDEFANYLLKVEPTEEYQEYVYALEKWEMERADTLQFAKDTIMLGNAQGVLDFIRKYDYN